MRNIESKEVNEWIGVLGAVKRGSDRHPMATKLQKILSRPKRRRVNVNMYKINKFSKDGENLIIPGKVLSVGRLDHKVRISAVNYSEKAAKALRDSGSELLSLPEMLKQKGIRILV